MPQVQMKPASAGAQYQHHYRPLSILSLDFGEIVPARVIETVKSDKWNNVKGNGFMRVAPADFPAYGRSYLKSASFFIPTYQLIEYADAFYEGQQLWHGKPVVKPGISTNSIIDIFNPASTTSVNLRLSTVVKEVQFGNTSDFPADNEFDLVIPVNHSSNSPYWHFLRLTSLGRRYYKLLCGLGYDFRGFNAGNTVDEVRQSGNIVVDALPIIAYLKMYSDYFLNIHMYNSSPLVQCLQHIREGNAFLYPGSTTEWVYNNDLLITSKGLRWLLDQVLLPWQSNMYLNSWNTMNDPIGVSGVNIADPNPSSPISLVLPLGSNSFADQNIITVNEKSVSINASVNNTSSSNAISALTQPSINTLYAFYQFVRRNKLFGSEAAKQAFARLGIKGNDFDSYFVRKLFEGSQEIDFAAVMSNANTVVPDSEQGSYLGSYAGAGLCSLDFNYNYQSSDYGYIIHVAYLQIDALMLHGFDPMVLRKNYLDHWTPEFDGKAQRAIPLMEISQSKFPAAENVQGRDDTPFGFTNLYEEYRNMRDLVIGDFRVGFAKNYVFARDYSFYRNGARDLLRPQTNRMQYFSRSGQNGEFSDPFMLSSSNGDRFYLQIKWQIDAVRPILSEEQALDLNGPGDTQLSTDSSQV